MSAAMVVSTAVTVADVGGVPPLVVRVTLCAVAVIQRSPVVGSTCHA